MLNSNPTITKSMRRLITRGVLPVVGCLSLLGTGVMLNTGVARAANATARSQPARPCSTESGKMSVSSDKSTQITFINNTSGPVNVYWLNYAGQRVIYYRGLAPNSSYVQGTYASHPWVVTNAANSCLATFMGEGHPTTATVS